MKLPTCKDVTQLASEALEHELSFRQRWGLRLHLWLCRNCRRFVRQLRFLHRASHAASADLPSRTALGREARDRIRQQLETGGNE